MKFRSASEHKPGLGIPSRVDIPAFIESAASVGEFVETHQRELWHYLRSAGCDAATAEDLAQEVFLIALRKGVRFRSARSARAYLRQSARYIVLQRWRTVRRGFEVAVDESTLDALDAHWRSAIDHPRGLEALRRCVGELHGRRRRAVELFYFEGRSRDEVAAALSMKPSGVKTLLQRVRADLRQCVERKPS